MREARLAEQSPQIGPPAARCDPARQRRDVDLVDQVTEEGRLGEELQVQER
jgi:hypothetical protein